MLVAWSAAEASAPWPPFGPSGAAVSGGYHYPLVASFCLLTVLNRVSKASFCMLTVLNHARKASSCLLTVLNYVANVFTNPVKR
jgi:hypothetical protein